MNKPIYRFEVQLSPQLTDGVMKHYWSIYLLDTKGNRITVRSGFTSTVVQAFKQANDLLPIFN